MRVNGTILLMLFFSSVSIGLTSGIEPNHSSSREENITIATDWENGTHAYKILGSLNTDYNWSVSITLNEIITQTFNNISDKRYFDLDINLIENDTVEIVLIGVSNNTDQPNIVIERNLRVAVWDDPNTAHEVAFSSNIEIFQNDNDEIFDLNLHTSGWQIGDENGRVVRDEVGNGTLIFSDGSEEQPLTVSLEINRAWRNKTSLRGEIQNEGYEFVGNGTMKGTLNQFGAPGEVNTTVHQAIWKRYWTPSQDIEIANLSASGNMGVNDSEMAVDAEIARLVFGYKDVNGTRHDERIGIEGNAIIKIKDDDGLDVTQYIDVFEFEEIIKDTKKVDSTSVLIGHGIIGAVIDQENFFVIINATIHNLTQIERDGKTLADTFHMSGTYTGDVEGTFGQVRKIEEVIFDTNATGIEFEVNKIRNQEWNNISGGILGGFAQMAGFEAYQNETLMHDVVSTNYENRTIFIAWEQTGSEPSSGSEKPERSPQLINERDNTSTSFLGSFDLRTARGMTPQSPITGDNICLNQLNERTLCLTFGTIHYQEIAGISGVEVIDWEGQYSTEGNASGMMIQNGPLTGLIAKSTHLFKIGTSEYILQEQNLDVILEPQIISREQNTAPIIEEHFFESGVFFNDGTESIIQVPIKDAERNIHSTEINSPSLNLDKIQLNDRGINGDRNAADGIWSAKIKVNMDKRGEFIMMITSKDIFGEEGVSTQNLILNEAPPKLNMVSFSLNEVNRGQEVTIIIQASDNSGIARASVDLQAYGNELIDMIFSEQTWSANINIPNGVIPGDFYPLIRLEDIHNVVTYSFSSTSILVLNDNPKLENLSISPNLIDRGKMEGVVEIIITVNAFDPDDLLFVQVWTGEIIPNGGWQMMEIVDSSENLFTTNISVRDSLPAGQWDLIIRAIDTKNSVSKLNATLTITIDTSDTGIAGIDEQTTNTLLWIAIGISITFIAIIVVIIAPRLLNDEEDETQ